MEHVSVEARGEALRGALDAACGAALKEIGARAAGYARALAPVDTGALRDSVDWAAADGAAAVGSSAPYAPFVELGGRPFLRPSIEEHLAEYRDVIEAALRGEAQRTD